MAIVLYVFFEKFKYILSKIPASEKQHAWAFAQLRLVRKTDLDNPFSNGKASQ
jgi:hypothetical protein